MRGNLVGKAFRARSGFTTVPYSEILATNRQATHRDCNKQLPQNKEKYRDLDKITYPRPVYPQIDSYNYFLLPIDPMPYGIPSWKKRWEALEAKTGI